MTDTRRQTADQDQVHSQPKPPQDVFEQKVHMLSLALETVGSKCNLLGTRLVATEEECKQFAERYFEAQEQAEVLRAAHDTAAERERLLRHDIMRLEALLDAERLQAGFTERKLQQMLGQEHLACEQARKERDSIVRQRDDAISELATAYADMDAMQATLADSAVYVRFMRKRVLELELEQTRHAAKELLGKQQAAFAEQEGVFSMESIKTAIIKAVQEAAVCDEDEKRKRIKQLQLRWHPDKNPVLAELATEVTKLINEAIAQHC